MFRPSILGGLFLLAAWGADVSAARAAEAVLRGQVVCTGCWTEADRAVVAYGTTGDLECARECAGDGIPAAIAIREGDRFVLVVLTPGSAGTERDVWLERTGRFFEVRGERRTVGDREEIRVGFASPLDGPPAGFLAPAPATAAVLGGEAPALELPDLRGVVQSLAALRGRIVVLNFWATWCKPCVEEMPALARLQRDLGAWGVQVVGAAADGSDAAGRVGAFARARDLSFPLWLGATTDAMRGFGLPEILPGTVVIDEQGRIAARFPGAFDAKTLREAVDDLLQRKGPRAATVAGEGALHAATTPPGRREARGSRVPT